MSMGDFGTYSLTLRLLKGGTPAGTPKTLQSISNDPLGPFQTQDFGASGVDLWGTTWTPEEINSQLSFDLEAAVNGTSVEVDGFSVIVFYDPPPAGGLARTNPRQPMMQQVLNLPRGKPPPRRR